MLGNVSHVLEPLRGLPEAARWKAVQARDRQADGSFVYAVRSTGVYCRPSCPSRKPKREQVLFFQLPEAAEQQGFRACQRCRPRSARGRDPKIEAVARVCREIDRRILADTGDGSGESRLTLAALSAPLSMSPHQLERAFRGVMGITPRQYADSQRMRRLKSRLKKGDNVTTALYEAGYGSSSRVYERAPGHLGMTPAAYGRGGEGMEIHYAIVGSPLGRLLVGATERGISAVYLGESDPALRTELRKEYPRAALVATSAAVQGIQALANGSKGFWRTCAAGSPISICRRTSRRPRSSAECGKSCAGFRTERHAPTAKSRGPSDALQRFAPWRARAPRIRLPLWCLATE